MGHEIAKLECDHGDVPNGRRFANAFVAMRRTDGASRTRSGSNVLRECAVQVLLRERAFARAANAQRINERHQLIRLRRCVTQVDGAGVQRRDGKPTHGMRGFGCRPHVRLGRRDVSRKRFRRVVLNYLDDRVLRFLRSSSAGDAAAVVVR